MHNGKFQGKHAGIEMRGKALSDPYWWNAHFKYGSGIDYLSLVRLTAFFSHVILCRNKKSVKKDIFLKFFSRTCKDIFTWNIFLWIFCNEKKNNAKDSIQIKYSKMWRRMYVMKCIFFLKSVVNVFVHSMAQKGFKLKAPGESFAVILEWASCASFNDAWVSPVANHPLFKCISEKSGLEKNMNITQRFVLVYFRHWTNNCLQLRAFQLLTKAWGVSGVGRFLL